MQAISTLSNTEEQLFSVFSEELEKTCLTHHETKYLLVNRHCFLFCVLSKATMLFCHCNTRKTSEI